LGSLAFSLWIPQVRRWACPSFEFNTLLWIPQTPSHARHASAGRALTVEKAQNPGTALARPQETRRGDASPLASPLLRPSASKTPSLPFGTTRASAAHPSRLFERHVTRTGLPLVHPTSLSRKTTHHLKNTPPLAFPAPCHHVQHALHLDSTPKTPSLAFWHLPGLPLPTLSHFRVSHHQNGPPLRVPHSPCL